MTGPMSNYATPPQLVESVPYADLGGMHQFAAQWRSEHRGQWLVAEKLSGFCLLIKRQVMDAVGGLDERFGLGFFDDDDLALRVKTAGFDLAVAVDLFIHHFGSRTFAGARIDTSSLLEKNHALFAEKWGSDAPPLRNVTLSAWSEKKDRERTRPVPSSKAKISLTMIVRDEQDNLPACLASAGDLFDEFVVVDTGSLDRTVDVARSLGAKVFTFPRVEDFAAARNAALSHATGDFAFWLDSDDRIEPSERECNGSA